MKLTQLFLCSAALTLPLALQAATSKNNDRWFEVEIILFSQLGDKSQLTESFPDSSELPKYRRVEDLLARYLNPDIRSLKQLLPNCETPEYPQDLIKTKAQLPALFHQKTLTQIAQLVDTHTSNTTVDANITGSNSTDLTDDSHFDDAAATDKLNARNNNTVTEINRQAANSESLSNSVLSNVDSNSDATNNNNLSNMADIDSVPLPSQLSAAKYTRIQQLVSAADAEFQQLKFQYSANVEPKLLCRIDQQHFADYQANNPSFDYYSFTVDKMPLLIDAPEDASSNQSHLLSKESLQLDDVIKDLKYSKNFRPLLHMGWRQVARPKKQSIPVKVYAGENFAVDHQKKLSRFNDTKTQQIAQLLEQTGAETSTISALTENIAADLEQVKSNQAEQLQAAKKARLEKIISQVSQVNDNTDELLTQLDHEDLSLKFAGENITTTTQATPPLPPVQPWFIDGFFNIHLKHYLFITADFNILDKNLSELATAQLASSTGQNTATDMVNAIPTQAKAIRFKQDRRVISGEVHYFDHPYMGMIVQIRPYTKPDLTSE
tara:strand:- start:23321 stop:24970 length:1650 start_codon:yes stop_codon:yes gene_type:complete